ncbi:GAF and ANTAR domain-containing protein [Kribbella sp. CA-253562]|uniref:GAF and ANTAR domain-containing protein n=1 Tax=Kribbella sp. CA-253562 TaxID=3239942 RepID=UPI003D92035C
MSTASPSDRLGQFADSVWQWHQLETVTEVAVAIATLGSRLHDGAGQFGVLLSHQRHLVPEAASSSRMALTDSLQVELREGPAIDAARDACAVYCPDLADARPWPRWAPIAVEHGWRCWASLQLLSRRQHVLGVLSYAHPEPDAVTPEVIERLNDLTVYAAVAIDSARIRENLRIAIDAQTHVGQAVGVLMERYGLTDDQAFAVLRRYSQDQQRKLRDVASDLLETRRLPARPEQ